MLSKWQDLCNERKFDHLLSIAQFSNPNQQYCIFKLLSPKSSFHALRAAAAILRNDDSGKMARKRARAFVDDEQNWSLPMEQSKRKVRTIESDDEISETVEKQWTIEKSVTSNENDRVSAAHNIFDDYVLFNRHLLARKQPADKNSIKEHDAFSYEKFPFIQFLDFDNIPRASRPSTLNGTYWTSSPFVDTRVMSDRKRAVWHSSLFLQQNIAGRICKSAEITRKTRRLLSDASKNLREISENDSPYLQNQKYGKRSCLQLRLRVMTKLFDSCRVPDGTLIEINGHVVQLYEEDGYSYENMFGYDVSEYARNGTNVMNIILNGDNCSANTRFVLNVVEWFDCEELIANVPRWTLEQSKEHVVRVFNIEETLHQHPFSMVETTIEDVFDCKPVRIAARFVDCAHMRCFDLGNFLYFCSLYADMMRCPVCNRIDTFDNLIVDEGFMECVENTIEKNCTKFRVYKSDLHISCFN